MTAHVEVNSQPLKGTLDVKRFYLDGVLIMADCPKCGYARCRDLGGDYLGYPNYGKPMPVAMYCEPCDFSFGIMVQLDISVRIV